MIFIVVAVGLTVVLFTAVVITSTLIVIFIVVAVGLIVDCYVVIVILVVVACGENYSVSSSWAHLYELYVKIKIGKLFKLQKKFV